MVRKNKIGSTQHELVSCDLEYPSFQAELSELHNTDPSQVDDFFKAVEKINTITWQQIYDTSSKGRSKRGLNWEVLPNQRTACGAPIASIRITRKVRARVTRDGIYMKFISLHPDHDSAYKAKGGEIV